jgi:hypothetical protein
MPCCENNFYRRPCTCCEHSCTGCVTGTGRPGTLSNVQIVRNDKLVPNWSTLDQIQKQIQNVVQVESSEYTMNRAATSTYDSAFYNRSGEIVARNQQSDRGVPHGMRYQNYAPHSSSTLRSLTRLRPNTSSAPTTSNGVDIKHNSYDRYLNRIKGRVFLEACPNRPSPLYGAKNKPFSIVHCKLKI